MWNLIISGLALFFLVGGSSFSVAAPMNGEVQKIIKSAKLKPEHFAIFAADGSGKPLAELHSKKMMIPASATKLLTAAAVLNEYPPGTKVKTSLWGGRIDGEVLKGPLVLVGAGDAAFVSETMWVLVNHFTRTGVRRVEGDLIVDDSLFSRVRFDESRQDQRVDRAYDAPTGAMSFNWNSINVYTRPSPSLGSPAKVFLDPENSYTRLSGDVKTQEGKRTSVSAERKSEKNGDLIQVSGSIGRDSDEHVQYKNITQPDLWAGHNLKGFLSQRGIQVSGEVKSGARPEGHQVLAEVESKPIELMVGDMNKFSNNYVAEMLTLHLGLKKGRPATIESGMQVVREFLKKEIKLTDKEFVVTNPSGLNRENSMTAQALWKVLNWAENHFQIFPEFLASLPIAGVDGTLKKRMVGTRGERSIRAKTGLLNGVAALAGYAGRGDGQIIPFVFIYNGGGDLATVRKAMDDMAVKLVTR